MRLLLSGLLLFAIAGCGDDTIPLSEYVERADGICRDVETKFKTSKSEQEFLDYQRAAMDRLEELPRPDEREQDAERFERLMREVIDSPESADGTFDETVKAARDLGMKICAQGTT